MGRALGAFDNGPENDRPDLNKCPDCGCFFGGDNCPLCGMECPPEMRAGNRKPVKQKKAKGGSGRVTFIDWYHRWWFIILMLFFMPVIGLILLATSPHKKPVKITVAVIAVVYAFSSYFGLGSIIYNKLNNAFNSPVDTSLTREEYIEKCTPISAQDYYRATAEYEEEFVAVELTVKEKFIDEAAYYTESDYTDCYVCDCAGSEYEIIIRDCLQDENVNFIPGDEITVYGEGAGNVTLYDMEYNVHSAPCISVAYYE